MKRALLIFLLMPLWCMAQECFICPGDNIKWVQRENNRLYDTVPIRIRPTEPEPAKAMSHIRITNDEVTEYIRMRTDTPDSTITIYGDTMEVVKRLFKELLECQKKSIVDKSTINLLFETLEIYKGIIPVPKGTVPSGNITLPTKTFTATFDSLGNIYFKEK